jgi:hypothetical protein
MGVRKKYEPYCPADCTGGTRSQLELTTAQREHLPADLAKRIRLGDVIFRCLYCQFVWVQKRGAPPGWEPSPLGYNGNPRWPGVFHVVDDTFPIRSENTEA